MSPGRAALYGAAGLWALNLIYLAVVGTDSGLWDYHFTAGEKHLSRNGVPGELPLAEAEYRKALDLALLMTPSDGRLTRTYHDLGFTYWIEHKYPEARRCYEKALVRAEREDGPDSWLVGVITFRLGELELRTGDRSLALAWLDRSQAILQKVAVSSDPLLLRCRADRGLTLAYLGRRAEALPILQELAPRLKGNSTVGDIVFQNELQSALVMCQGS